MSPELVSVPLYRLAHSRSGDKGDISNLSLIAWDPDCYALLADQVPLLVLASARLLLGVGVLGGYTTFSSFSLDTIALVSRGQVGLAAFYVAISLIAGFAALFAGLSITKGVAA